MASSVIAAQGTETGQKASIHPLVLLTASDLITRHRLRQLQGPVAGILLGQIEGTKITAEHAFTAKIKDGLLDQDGGWTFKRIEQYKEVHKNPVLEVVGWFTLCPEDGPLPEHAAIQKQLTTLYAETAIMLAIHPNQFSNLSSTKGKLPISVYESVMDGESAGGDGAMQVDGKEVVGLRFRSVPFTIDTDETEMIAINYVAKGAGSAAAIVQAPTAAKKDTKEESSTKLTTDETSKAKQQRGPVMTAEEEDQIAGLTTKLNSVKMLHERLELMSKLVESVPPSYLSDQTLPISPSSPTPEHLVQLRNIQALLTRLSLLTPMNETDSEALKHASQAQANDVTMSSLLAMLGQDVQGLTELGRKFMIVEQSKSNKIKSKGGLGQGGYGSFDDYNGRASGPDVGMLMT